MAAQGRDVKLDPAYRGLPQLRHQALERARFAEMNGVRVDPAFEPQDAKLQINRWILTEFSEAAREVAQGIDQYRFNDAASAALPVRVEPFCDWYLELLKPVFNGEDESAKAEAQACAACARRRLQAAAPVHAVHDGRALGADGRSSRRAAVSRGMAASRIRRHGSGRGGQLADRSRDRHPFGSGGDERAGLGDGAAGHCRRWRRNPPAAAAARSRDQAAGARRG
jgi:hypothetical protein